MFDVYDRAGVLAKILVVTLLLMAFSIIFMRYELYPHFFSSLKFTILIAGTVMLPSVFIWLFWPKLGFGVGVVTIVLLTIYMFHITPIPMNGYGMYGMSNYSYSMLVTMLVQWVFSGREILHITMPNTFSAPKSIREDVLMNMSRADFYGKGAQKHFHFNSTL